MSDAPPALSVILVTPDTAETLAKILRVLGEQTIAARIEVVIGAPDPAAVAIDEAVRAPFFDLRVVAADASTSARARAAAIRASRAPVVALGEDHCFPQADWAERLVQLHEGPWAVVGPVVDNANPDTATSWANLVVEYGEWLPAREDHEPPHLPGHNSAYKRDVLMSYDNRLEDMLESESVLHWDLRARGHRLLLTPSLRVYHLNYSLPGRAMRLQFLAGRAFAASRTEGWPLTKRLGYALASPAIPVVRFARAMRQLMQLSGGGGLALRCAPMTFLLFLCSGVGEGLGALAGDGGVRATLARYEFHRWRNLLPREQALAR